ncbi:MAG: DUF924 family protein [Myxococcota bacterium]
MHKPAPIDYAIAEPLVDRWSPRAFSEAPVDDWTLRRLFEAARWAPSSFNEQPWCFIVPRDDADRDGLVACLTEKNRLWAQRAPVLFLVCCRTTFSKNGQPNRHAAYDTGCAMGALSFQATQLGLFLHQMAGFDSEQARKAGQVPEDLDIMAVVAVGHRGSSDLLPADLEARETAPRSRMPQSDFVRGPTHATEWSFEDEALASSVVAFWCSETDADGFSLDPERWWEGEEAFDRLIRERFSQVHERALAGGLDPWVQSRTGRVAYIIVLDQFSRNLHRGTPRMLHGDSRARAVALDTIDRGWDERMPGDQRGFVYMPLMHSEDLSHQERCIELFERFQASAPARHRERIRRYVGYARRHRDIIERFGRFPHRNVLLGRESTESEQAFLGTEGSSFGSMPGSRP